MNILYYQYFEYLSFLVALICYKGLKQYSLQWFIPLLFLGCLADTLGENYKRWGLNKLTTHDENYLIYNPYLLLYAPIMLYLFLQIFQFKRKNKIIFIGVAIVVITLLLLNYINGEGMYTFNSNSVLLIALITIFLSALVLVRLALHEEKSKSIFKEPYFWICSGMLLFGISELILGLQKYIVENDIKILGESIYNLVMAISNIILGLTLSLGFILTKVSSE